MKAAFWAVMAGCVGLLPAQGNEDPMVRAIAEAKRELAEERERIAAEREARARVLDELIARRDALSDRWVDAELALAAQAPQLAEVREARAVLRDEVDSITAGLARVPTALQQARGKLADMLDVLPPLGLGTPSGYETWNDFAEGLGRLLDVSDGIAQFPARIRTPQGSEEDASILRMGMIAWAYRIGAGVGLRLNAPGPEDAYRWDDQLAPGIGPAAAAAMSTSAGGAAPASFPFDVTAQMEVETRTRLQGPLATIVAGGPVMVPLAAVALLAALLVVARLLFLARVGTSTGRLTAKVFEHAEAGNYQAATEVCRNKPAHPVARALAACLARRDQGAQAMEDAVQEVVLHEAPRLERFLSTIGILASIAPLLGLLGTVTGMILTFEMIASLGSGNPRLMAGGISQALITTASGLVVAIPILLMHSFLSGRVDRLIADVERFGAQLLNVMREHRSREV